MSFIEKLPFKIEFHDFRLDTFDLWSHASSKLEGGDLKQLLLFTNEDHLLLPGAEGEFAFIAALQEKLQAVLPQKVLMVPLSHFPESHAVMPVAKMAGRLSLVDKVPLVPCQIPAGPIIISKSSFQKIWDVDFTEGSKFVGLENPFGNSLRLSNGLYLPPRTELFRHFDSYGHVNLDFWPYNLIEPNVQISDGSNEANIDFQYQLSSSIHEPSGKEHQLLASDGDEQIVLHENIAMSILKAGLRRPSLDSARWVATKYALSDSELHRVIWFVLKRSKKFREAHFTRLWHFPGHLFLGFLGRAVERLGRIDLEFTWFLTYGSGVGFLRLFRMSWPNILRKLRARGIGKNDVSHF